MSRLTWNRSLRSFDSSWMETLKSASSLRISSKHSALLPSSPPVGGATLAPVRISWFSTASASAASCAPMAVSSAGSASGVPFDHPPSLPASPATRHPGHRCQPDRAQVAGQRPLTAHHADQGAGAAREAEDCDQRGGRRRCGRWPGGGGGADAGDAGGYAAAPLLRRDHAGSGGRLGLDDGGQSHDAPRPLPSLSTPAVRLQAVACGKGVSDDLDEGPAVLTLAAPEAPEALSEQFGRFYRSQ